MLPIFQSQPGFKAYSVVEAGGEIISFSAWDSAEAAEAASVAATEWITANIADQLELKNTHFGEILFSTTLGISTKAGVTA